MKNLPANAGDIRDSGSIPGLGRSPGGGHSSPLQYSCLGNPMDRGAWRAAVHRVTKRWTQLKRLSSSSSYRTRHQGDPGGMEETLSSSTKCVPTCHLLCCAKTLQSCPTLSDPMGHSPPGSSVHGFLQARVVEGAAVPSSRGSSQPRDQTLVS